MTTRLMIPDDASLFEFNPQEALPVQLLDAEGVMEVEYTLTPSAALAAALGTRWRAGKTVSLRGALEDGRFDPVLPLADPGSFPVMKGGEFWLLDPEVLVVVGGVGA